MSDLSIFDNLYIKSTHYKENFIKQLVEKFGIKDLKEIELIHYVPNNGDYIQYKSLIFKETIVLNKCSVSYHIIRVDKLGD